MFRRIGVFFILVVAVLIKYILPEEKPEIIPFPQQSVSDKGDFIFNESTLISVENEKQAAIAQEFTSLFNLAAGFTPKVTIQNKKADIIFHTDKELESEHYKLNIGPSCILVKASGQKGFFYAMQTLHFLLPSAINSPTPVKNIRWSVPGMTILDGPRHKDRVVVLYTPFNLIPKDNLKELIDCMAMLKINRLHFIQELYDVIPTAGQKTTDNMILYAQTKKVTISSGTIPTKGVTSNLPFQVEDIIRESNIQHSKDNKKILFQCLASIAEKSWSDLP